MGEAKRYDILRLDPQDAPIYLILEAFSPDEERDALEYYYEERTCPPDILSRVEEVITEGDTDPHGLFEYVRTTEELEYPVDWAQAIPEAFAGRREHEFRACEVPDQPPPPFVMHVQSDEDYLKQSGEPVVVREGFELQAAIGRVSRFVTRTRAIDGDEQIDRDDWGDDPLTFADLRLLIDAVRG